jgi:uncharacterized protein
MLTNTFLHIPYVNETTESRLWKNNILSWDDFLSSNARIPNRETISNHLKISKENYEKKNYSFFATKLLSRYHWRAYDDFKDKCCFLDIETSGLSKYDNELTVIGLYDGKKSKTFINGKNLEQFPEELKKYSYIVTFNGSLFDIPFIKAKFPGLVINQFHADLRFIMRNLGYTGGLKKIEKDFGIVREGDLAGLTGYDAVKLWQLYKKHNDEKALDKLVRYNIEDIENLKELMDFSYNELRQKCIGEKNL